MLSISVSWHQWPKSLFWDQLSIKSSSVCYTLVNECISTPCADLALYGGQDARGGHEGSSETLIKKNKQQENCILPGSHGSALSNKKKYLTHTCTNTHTPRKLPFTWGVENKYQPASTSKNLLSSHHLFLLPFYPYFILVLIPSSKNE